MHKSRYAPGSDHDRRVNASLPEGPEAREPKPELLEAILDDLGVPGRAGRQANTKRFDILGIADERLTGATSVGGGMGHGSTRSVPMLPLPRSANSRPVLFLLLVLPEFGAASLNGQ